MKLVLIIVILCALAIGILILILSGISFVGKNKNRIVERLGEFYKVLGPGLHYCHPFVLRVVGTYSLQKQSMVLKLKTFVIEVEYQIADAKKYHYSGHCFDEWMKDSLNELSEAEEIKTTILDYASDVGIEIISLNIYSNNSN